MSQHTTVTVNITFKDHAQAIQFMQDTQQLLQNNEGSVKMSKTNKHVFDDIYQPPGVSGKPIIDQNLEDIMNNPNVPKFDISDEKTIESIVKLMSGKPKNSVQPVVKLC